jgi:hypothetical protein
MLIPKGFSYLANAVVRQRCDEIFEVLAIQVLDVAPDKPIGIEQFVESRFSRC